MILAGDIGGTKTVLALFDPVQSVERPLREATFRSSKYTALEEVLQEFLAEESVAVTAATFGVAGPVWHGRSQITNLPWVIDAAAISQAFHIPRVHLLNDLEAIATAVPYLGDNDRVTLQIGQPEPTGVIAVVAPGTGLGEAFLVWNGRRYQAYPTEGGHVSFAPGTDKELEMLRYLQPRFGHVSFERVGSGSGIPNIYDYLRQTGRYVEPDWLQTALTQADDRTPIIFDAALNAQADICVATLELFVRILAGEIGNMALKVMARGGVFLGGGLPPRLLPWLQQPAFREAMSHKGRFQEWLSHIPIHVILHPKVALYGAAYHILQEPE